MPQTYPHTFEESFELAAWLVLSPDADGFGYIDADKDEAMQLPLEIHRNPGSYREEWLEYQHWKGS